MSQAFVLHGDADAFYAAVACIELPHLAGLPIAVVGNQGACVIARSYEMREAGVKTGQPVWEAQELCPEGVYVRRNFRLYQLYSQMILGVMREYCHRVEYYSIDEFFCELAAEGKGDLEQIAREIQAIVRRRVGVPMTLGVSSTRTLAKLFSDSAKPYGVRVAVDRDEVDAYLAALPVTEISGIAGRRARTLEAVGIRNCLEFARADRRLIRKLLTVHGEILHCELNGDPIGAIRIERPARKALARGGSMGRGNSTSDPNVLWAWVVRHTERLIEELAYHEVCPSRLTIQVQYRKGEVGTGSVRLELPTQRFDLLLDAARVCTRAAWIPGKVSTRMHVIGTHLVPLDRVPLGLFLKDDPRAEAVAGLKQRINKKVGRFAVRSAATLPLIGIYEDEASNFDICDIPEKMCF